MTYSTNDDTRQHVPATLAGWGDNELLHGLHAQELEWLDKQLEAFPLRPHAVLAKRGEVPDYVYFPSGGLVSIFSGRDGLRTEIGLLGREGISAPVMVLGDKVAMHDYVVDVGGNCQRLPTTSFIAAVKRCPNLERRLHHYLANFVEQVGESACIASLGSIEERLVRRLLMASDRLETDGLAFTHEALAGALCVRRPSVTLALHVLEGRHLLRSQRGSIEIIDRPNLEALVQPYYAPPVIH